ncbi:MAG: hypothetical protein WAT79_09320, partial [Saprospiraceae bacterium]
SAWHELNGARGRHASSVSCATTPWDHYMIGFACRRRAQLQDHPSMRALHFRCANYVGQLKIQWRLKGAAVYVMGNQTLPTPLKGVIIFKRHWPKPLRLRPIQIDVHHALFDHHADVVARRDIFDDLTEGIIAVRTSTVAGLLALRSTLQRDQPMVFGQFFEFFHFLVLKADKLVLQFMSISAQAFDISKLSRLALRL